MKKTTRQKPVVSQAKFDAAKWENIKTSGGEPPSQWKFDAEGGRDLGQRWRPWLRVFAEAAADCMRPGQAFKKKGEMADITLLGIKRFCGIVVIRQV